MDTFIFKVSWIKTINRQLFLEENGQKSVGKRNRALNIRYFFDQVSKGNLEIQYCKTDNMIGDFMTKPVQGNKFREFRDTILGK